MICYLFLFFGSLVLIKFLQGYGFSRHEILKKSAILVFASLAAFYLGILLWPFALQSPFRNVMQSYHVMAHFPSTFREIFNGTREWSDFVPWYYLPEYMLITIPLVVLAGPLLFAIYCRKSEIREKWIEWLFLAFTLFFPVVFAIINKSNIYSGWRQFLFVYPPLVIFSAAGFSLLIEKTGKKLNRWLVIVLLFLLSVNPVSYMARNP